MLDLPFQIAFDRPWFLVLLVLIPGLWYLSFQSLAGLGAYRRWSALVFRTLVVTLLVMALAEAKWQLKTDRLTVIYLLDQSQSIPEDIRQTMVDYVIEDVDLHRRDAKQDRAGVIVFGAQAKIESAPYDGRLPLIGRLEATVDLDDSGTNLEAALKLAKASFPEDSARRIVIVSDGNENLGDARSIARAMSDDGIGIDVVPIQLVASAEISVDKVVLPTDVRKDQEFETRVLLTNQAAVGGQERPVTGSLRLVRRSGQTETVVAEQNDVTLQPGKNIIGFTSKLDRSGVFTTEAVFVPDDKTQDLIPQNNQASAFTRVRGKGKVLLIEDAYARGEFFHLIDRLNANAIEVDVTHSGSLYTSASELLQYDAVILANVPRSSSDDEGIDAISGFSDAQVKILVDNCERMGCGIVMLGGDRAFGAGAWSNSLLEEAMPIDFQIKNKKVSAVGALAMVMHASEMPQGNFWQVKIGEAALDVLGPMDYCGVVDWSDMRGNPKWLWQMPNGVDQVFQNKPLMMKMIRNMQPGDMPEFQSAMRLMLKGLLATDASMRHAIIISDGDPVPPTAALLAQFKANNIKISTVGVGTHGAASRKELERIADATGGKYWGVTNPKALPKIYQREARRVARPVIKESATGMSAIPVAGSQGHEIMKGLTLESLPPFYGYVMSTIKNSALVEQLALSNDPSDDNGENSTLLATWRYGNGRTVAFTSDAGHKWTSQWFNDDQYDKLFVQMIRHAMRPITEAGEFTVASEVRDGVARIVVTALDKNEAFLNFLDMSGTGIYSGGTGVDQPEINLEFTQVGPGRYVAEHQIQGTGNLLYSIFPGEGYEKLTAGINVPYSNEYSDRESNLNLLTSLANLKPRGGAEGTMAVQPLTRNNMEGLLQQNSFRPTLTAAISVQDIWPILLMMGAAIFFSDVFVRRVATQLPANTAAFAMCLPLAWMAYFGTKWYLIRKSFEPNNSVFLDEPSMPLVVATLIGFFVALYLAFVLSSEWVTAKVSQLMATLLRRDITQPEVSLSRLQSRKAEIEAELETRRASTRFEPVESEAGTRRSGQQQLDDVLASEIEKTPALPPKINRDPLDTSGDGSYTSRLLDAKRKLRKRQGRDQTEPDKPDSQ